MSLAAAPPLRPSPRAVEPTAAPVTGAPAAADGHPFAAYLRTVGRGSTLGRPLDEAEAEAAMAMILEGAVDRLQLGAFLLVLRYRTETPAELAGFVRAARRRMALPTARRVDLDWPSYADRHKQLPYFLLAALLLCESGVRVLMHGIDGEGPATTPAGLAALGLAPSRSPAEAAERLDAEGFAYLPLMALCPELAALFGLRPLLGLRTPVNSFARELNPFEAPHQIQGVFHPTYLPLHRETARLLRQPRAVIFKGGGGEAQRNPEKPCRTVTVHGGGEGEAVEEEVWPALAPDEAYPWRREPLDPARLATLWRGDEEPVGPTAAIVGTAAVALRLLGRAATRDDAQAQAAALWRARPRAKYPLRR